MATPVLKGLFNRGQMVCADSFVLRHMANLRRNNFRLTIIVSKKIDKRAVIRNRIRRRLYELFRTHLSKNNLKADLALIVLSRDLAEKPFHQLQKDFEPVFKTLASKYGD